MRITEDDTVEGVMRDDPGTIRTFLDFKFGCVGCPIGSFHSVVYACREHGTEVATFLAALRQTGTCRAG
jgi:hybrid cluster-associated redox disulfide protein